MTRRRPRDLSHTARCLDCGAWNVYPGGVIGTPLVIFHGPTCPQHPDNLDSRRPPQNPRRSTHDDI